MRGAILLACLLSLSISGCDYGETLLGEGERSLDPRQPFPDFVKTTAAEGPWAFPLCGGWEGSGSRLRLGGLFTLELPAEVGWRRAATAGAGVVVRAPGSATPTAYLYAERIDPGAVGGFGAALRRFQGRVDRRLQPLSRAAQKTSERVAPPPADTSEDQITEAEDGAADLPAAAQEAALGVLVPGYYSQPGSFTGWRWMGQCGEPGGAPGTAHPFVRLSRTRGLWRRPGEVEPVPAFMMLATVTLTDRRNYGIYLALVCTETPQCQESPALARLLGSLRIASPEAPTATSDWGEENFNRLAARVGIDLPESAAR